MGDSAFPASAMVGAGRLEIPGIFQSTIYMYDNAFTGGPDWARGIAIHELAHVIDFHAQPYKQLSNNLPHVGDGYIGAYGEQNGNIEYFAEAVTMWVFDKPTGNNYRDILNLPAAELPDELANFLDANLVATP